MRRMPFVFLFVWALPVAAQAAPVRIDITYTEGKIVSGPLTPDLDELPSQVTASFKLSSASGELADVTESSLVFGDGEWNLDDLESFSASFLPTDAGGLAVVSLSYAYRPIDTSTSNDKLAANFPLTIQGTDLASGLEFHYQYDVSSQTVTEIPEPSSIVLAALGLAVLAVTARARGDCLRRDLRMSDRQTL